MKVYRSNRTEELVAALAQVLRRPLGTPLCPETVVVHSKGVERWIAMELARRLGVCAGLRFPFPGNLVVEALGASAPGAAEHLASWSPARLRWNILELLPTLLALPEFAVLRAYLTDDPQAQGRQALQLAQRIAEVFDQYLVYRQDLIRQWTNGGDQQWQAVLFRALRGRLDRPHLVEIADSFLAAARRRSLRLAGFPSRVSFFGISTLPPFYVQLLAALNQLTDIHLFVLCPTREYWADIRPLTQQRKRRSATAASLAGQLELYREVGHPLLASLGKLGRDFQESLEANLAYEEPFGELFVDSLASSGSPSLLHQLQSDMLSLEDRGSPGGPPPVPVAPHDRSIQLHACHGPLRQVEVLRDQLWGLFHEHPDLQPRDIVVMTPDLATFAPLVEAVFDLPLHQEGSIPFQISDRPLGSHNPVAAALLQVLDLAHSRLTASQLLDLLALEPVRIKFGLTTEDLDRITDWVQQTCIRWGIDGRHRLRHGQPEYHVNSWRFGLERLLLGHALPGEEHRLFLSTLPFDDVEGDDADRAGKLAALCHTLFGFMEALEGPARTVVAWQDLLSEMLRGLFETEPTNRWQEEEVHQALASLAEEAEAAGSSTPIETSALQQLLRDHFGSSPTPRGFLSGKVTFCAMVPLRSIPFRVVCLLGLDEKVFPRSTGRISFDLVAKNPRPGDRSPRNDDRQMFLEALLSARDFFLVTYTGRSLRDHRLQPPSVVVSELLDYLCQSCLPPGAESAPDDPQALRQALLEQVVTHHPLQPFDPRYFGESSDARLFTYAAEHLPAARQHRAQRFPAPAFLDGPWDSVVPQTIALEALRRFFALPLAEALRHSLGLSLEERLPLVIDHEPVELDGLDRFVLAQTMLERELAGEDREMTFSSLQATGVLPWGKPGRCIFEDQLRDIQALAHRVRALRGRSTAGSPLNIDLSLCEGTLRLVGRVSPVWTNGLVVSRWARPKGRTLLDLWLCHLAVHGQQPDRFGESWLVTRPESGDGAAVTALAVPEQAVLLLERLVRLYLTGLRAPLSFFPESSWAYARTLLRAGRDEPEAVEQALRAATNQWEAGTHSSGEGGHPLLQRVFPHHPPFGPQDTSSAATDVEPSSFEQLALAVYEPLLRHIRRSDEP